MADRSAARLIVVHATDPLLVAAAAIELHDRHFARRSAAELRRFVRASVPHHMRNRVQVSCRVVVGSAADEILATASRTRSDLIVMGTHGLTGADRLILGSTTLGVLQRTAVPVLAVPPPTARGRSIRSGWPRGPVVAAIELDRPARAEVEISARIARWLARPLRLLHVIERPNVPGWLRSALRTRDRERLARAHDELEKLARIARREVATDTRVGSGHPARVIASSLAAARSEFLITALRDRRGWFGARRGSVSYHVLSRAVVPVLACPRQWRPR